MLIKETKNEEERSVVVQRREGRGVSGSMRRIGLRGSQCLGSDQKVKHFSGEFFFTLTVPVRIFAENKDDRPVLDNERTLLSAVLCCTGGGPIV